MNCPKCNEEFKFCEPANYCKVHAELVISHRRNTKFASHYGCDNFFIYFYLNEDNPDISDFYYIPDVTKIATAGPLVSGNFEHCCRIFKLKSLL